MTEVGDLARSAPTTQAVYYPETDGQPIGETDTHINVIFYLRQALRYFFRRTETVYVAANLFLYYQEGDPHARQAPDVFVVKGVPKFDRRTYKLWEELVSPCTIFEITLPSTRLKDFGDKKGLYETLGVEEYFLFDPLGEYLEPRLQGFRLTGGEYEPLTLSSAGTLFSQTLGVILKPEGKLLRIVDPTSGEAIPTLDEALAQTQAAEAELTRLRAELAQLRGEANEVSNDH